MRHADAGYSEALACAERFQLKLPSVAGERR
jgi:urocanate hydratase